MPEPSYDGLGAVALWLEIFLRRADENPDPLHYENEPRPPIEVATALSRMHLASGLDNNRGRTLIGAWLHSFREYCSDPVAAEAFAFGSNGLHFRPQMFET